MSRDEELQDTLRKLARAVPQRAGGAVERELRAKFRARRRQRKVAWTYLAEAVALAIAVAGLYLGFIHGRPTQRSSTTSGALNQGSGFIMLPYAQSDVPMEQPVIVRVKISLSELRAIGMPLSGAPRGNVSADLLIGQDGVARAVRLVE